MEKGGGRISGPREGGGERPAGLGSAGPGAPGVRGAGEASAPRPDIRGEVSGGRGGAVGMSEPFLEEGKAECSWLVSNPVRGGGWEGWDPACP